VSKKNTKNMMIKKNVKTMTIRRNISCPQNFEKLAQELDE
jgi:hypothetical protein